MSMSDIARLENGRFATRKRCRRHVALEPIAFTAKPVTRFNPGRLRGAQRLGCHRLEDCGSCNIVLAVGV